MKQFPVTLLRKTLSSSSNVSVGLATRLFCGTKSIFNHDGDNSEQKQKDGFLHIGWYGHRKRSIEIVTAPG